MPRRDHCCIPVAALAMQGRSHRLYWELLISRVWALGWQVSVSNWVPDWLLCCFFKKKNLANTVPVWDPVSKLKMGWATWFQTGCRMYRRPVKAATWYWEFLVHFTPFAFKDPKGFRNYEHDFKCTDSTLVHRNFELNASSRSHKAMPLSRRSAVRITLYWVEVIYSKDISIKKWTGISS